MSIAASRYTVEPARNVSALPTAQPALRVTFIVPAHNEAATIGEVLQRIGALNLDAQVLIVDDGSRDGTAEIAESELATLRGLVIRQPNRGKGAAIRAAIPHVDGEVVVIQDADMEYDPR